MFQYLSIPVKIIILSIIFSILTVILYISYTYSFASNVAFGMVMDLAVSLTVLLYAFFFFQTYKKLRVHKGYYERRSFERPSFFKKLGVPIYRYILINSFVRHFNPRVYFKGKTREYIKTYHEETKIAETCHIVALIPTFGFQLIYLFQSQYTDFCLVGVFNILINVYPILLQRQNRFMIEDKFQRLLNKA